jgi:hypothetical protein
MQRNLRPKGPSAPLSSKPGDLCALTLMAGQRAKRVNWKAATCRWCRRALHLWRDPDQLLKLPEGIPFLVKYLVELTRFRQS